MTEDLPPGRPLTAEDVVRRIAAECAFISANGEVGIRIEPAAEVLPIRYDRGLDRPAGGGKVNGTKRCCRSKRPGSRILGRAIS
jgi:hypothetical protein